MDLNFSQQILKLNNNYCFKLVYKINTHLQIVNILWIFIYNEPIAIDVIHYFRFHSTF